MEKENLTQPIHLTQQNEKPRPSFYRQQFFEYNGNLTQYTNHLAEKWRELGDSLENLTPSIRKELERYFTPGDIEKNAKCHNLIMKGEKNVLPSWSNINKWSYCDLWLYRKQSFLNSREEEINNYALQSELENKEQIIDLQSEFRIELLKTAVALLKENRLNGTQAQGYASANKNIQDAQNRDRGEAKDISSLKADVSATTENTHGIDETVYKELLDVIKPRYNRND